MMATEVATPATAELTDLGKCLTKHEVGGGAGEFLVAQPGNPLPLSSLLMPSGAFGLIILYRN